MLSDLDNPNKVRKRTVAGGGETEQGFRGLIRCMGLVKRVMEPWFGQFGISAPQWAVLSVLQRANDAGEAHLRLGDLGQRLLIRPPSVTGIVGRLERSGLVVRQVSEEDQREKLVGLSSKGKELVGRVRQKHPEQIRRLLGGLTPEEQEQLRELLGKLAGHLEGLAGEMEHEQDKDEA